MRFWLGVTCFLRLVNGDPLQSLRWRFWKPNKERLEQGVSISCVSISTDRSWSLFMICVFSMSTDKSWSLYSSCIVCWGENVRIVICVLEGGGGYRRWLSWLTSGVRQLHAKHYKNRYYNSHFGDFQKLIDLHMYIVVCLTRLPYHITYWKEGLNVILTDHEWVIFLSSWNKQT